MTRIISEMNQTYMLMLAHAKALLEKRDPRDIAEKAGVKFDEAGSLFLVPTLGQVVEIPFPGCEKTQEIEDYYQLVILHYLDMADGVPLSHRWIPLREGKDGSIRGANFDTIVDKTLARLLADTTPEQCEKACRALGGEIMKDKADLTVVFPLLPRYPLHLSIWFADDEFPAAGKLLIDASECHYLSMEDAVTIGEELFKLLEAELKNA